MAAERAHPTPKMYVQIFVVLVVITGVEVGLSYAFDVFGKITVVLLLIAAAMKFLLVVGFYMHLRFDAPMLSRFFASGFALAIILYAIVLATFGTLFGVFLV